MYACCYCFGGAKETKKSESLPRPKGGHYELGIEPVHTKNSLVSSGAISDLQMESVTSSSSLPQPSDSTRSLTSSQPYISLLYFPTKEPLSPCSPQVTGNSSLFDEFFELESSSDWDLKLDKRFACVMVRTGTPRNPEIPIMKAFFDLELDLFPEDIYRVIYDPEVRRKWDGTIGAYEEINKEVEDVIQYYMLNKAPWPFKDRDFVETRFIRRRVNGDMEIVFRASENSQFEENPEKAIRGVTAIGGQVFRRRLSHNTGKMSLMVTTIVQADLRGEIPKKALKVTLPVSVLKWYMSVKKQLSSKHNT